MNIILLELVMHTLIQDIAVGKCDIEWHSQILYIGIIPSLRKYLKKKCSYK